MSDKLPRQVIADLKKTGKDWVTSKTFSDSIIKTQLFHANLAMLFMQEYLLSAHFIEEKGLTKEYKVWYKKNADKILRKVRKRIKKKK